MGRDLELWRLAWALRFLRLDKMWWSLWPVAVEDDWLNLSNFRG